MIRNEIAQILLGLGVSLATTTVHAQCAPAAQRLISDRKYEAVRVQLEAQIKRAPSDDVAMHCMGRLLLEQNESGDAVDWLEKAVQVNATKALASLKDN